MEMTITVKSLQRYKLGGLSCDIYFWQNLQIKF